MALTDTIALVKRARDGDESARGRLLEHLRPRLVLWCSSRMSPALRAKVEPEDLAQEVLLALHKGLDQYDGSPGRAFYAWMFRVAENRIRDSAEHFGAQKRRSHPLPNPPSQTTPSMFAVREESFARLRRAVEQLPDDYRTVIRLRRFEELDVPVIAEQMGRTPNAVRVLYCRALKALKKQMV